MGIFGRGWGMRGTGFMGPGEARLKHGRACPFDMHTSVGSGMRPVMRYPSQQRRRGGPFYVRHGYRIASNSVSHLGESL